MLQIFEAKGRRDAATRGGVGSAFLFFLLRFFLFFKTMNVFLFVVCVFLSFSPVAFVLPAGAWDWISRGDEP